MGMAIFKIVAAEVAHQLIPSSFVKLDKAATVSFGPATATINLYIYGKTLKVNFGQAAFSFSSKKFSAVRSWSACDDYEDIAMRIVKTAKLYPHEESV